MNSTVTSTDAQYEREDDEDSIDDMEHRDRAKSLEDLDMSDDDDESVGNGDSAKRTLDPAMLNELLLICSNLGVMTETETGEKIFTRGEDCEEWVHDLQRAIRRDHAVYRLIAKTLGRWQILQKKLLPLLINHQRDWYAHIYLYIYIIRRRRRQCCRLYGYRWFVIPHDTILICRSLVFSILKVLVMLTMKPANESENIAMQLKFLRDYKRAFLQHGLVQLLMSILVDPLSREGSARTSQVRALSMDSPRAIMQSIKNRCTKMHTYIYIYLSIDCDIDDIYIYITQ
jgi:timeless